MDRNTSIHRALTTALLLILMVATLGAALEAGPAKKNKKKAKNKPATGTSQVLKDVQASLIAYDTGQARALLEPLPQDQDAEVVSAWGQVLQQEQNFSAAAERFEAAAEMAPRDPAPFVYLGFDHLYANQKSKAQGAFRSASERAISLLAEDPENAEALYHLGVAQQRLDKFDEAFSTLEKARGASPKDPMIVFQMGVTRALQQQWQPAVGLLTEALQKNDRIAYAYYYRGLAADRLSRKDLLINDMDRFLALAPDAPEADRARRILQAAGG